MAHYDETSDERKRKSNKPKEKKKDEASNSDEKTKKPLKCWICVEPHTVKNCPSRLKVAAMAESNMKKEETFVGVMQILGAAAAMEVVK